MLKRILAGLLGAMTVANGAVMLAYGERWYAMTPGVPHTGPYNPHFVADIGAAFLAEVSRGDARVALNALETAWRSRSAAANSTSPRRRRRRTRPTRASSTGSRGATARQALPTTPSTSSSTGRPSRRTPS